MKIFVTDKVAQILSFQYAPGERDCYVTPAWFTQATEDLEILDKAYKILVFTNKQKSIV